MSKPSDTLDRITRTFTADGQFFDELMAQPSGETFVEMYVWFIWLKEYLHDIQNSLHEAGAAHGNTYQIWVVSMIAGIAQSIGILMYLLCRGVVHEAAAAARRELEYLGMLSHLVLEPSKGEFLCNAETEAPDFKTAFIRGRDKTVAERLKRDGIRYRFSGMSAGNAKTATQLYELFSRFNVHGGTMSSLLSVAMVPTKHSCSFHNRSLAEVARNLPLFKMIVEITAGELMVLVGEHGIRSKRTEQAGACVLIWLDGKDPRWRERVQAMRENFGLGHVSSPS